MATSLAEPTTSAASTSPPLPWAELERIAGAGNILRSKEDLITYSFDGTAALRQMPAAVVFARNAREISEILKLANQSKVPVVTRGSGTGLSGGSLSSENCIVLCTVRMHRNLKQ